MPPHEVYIEPFLGSGAVMRAKRPASLNIGMDLSGSAIDEFNAERSPSGKGGEDVWAIARGDGLQLLESYVASRQTLGDEYLIYCDPPYLMSTRRDHAPAYDHEFALVDHRRLLRVIRELPCRVMISGYESQLYRHELEARGGWNRIEFEAMTRGGQMATEVVWYNYPTPIELHDYRYLGDGFRERERIKRKIARWTAKLAKMPILERQALTAAMSVLP